MAATTRYVIDKSTFTVDPQAKLGAGSEGMVIEHPANPRHCVKLFHPADPTDRTAQQIAAYRSRKIVAICTRRPSLPPQFTLPLLPAYDLAQLQAIGYEMRRVPQGHEKLIKLLDGSFRASHQVGLRMVSELFADIFDDLELIHNAGLAVGDVNLGCVMFQPGKDRAWVDTDSWSYPGFPCLATTEMFAHPDLYVNLTGNGSHVEPAPRHDRFAFLVAFSLLALPGAHPFRMGSHPTVKGLQNRAIQEGSAIAFRYAAELQQETGMDVDVDIIILTDGANNEAPRDSAPVKQMIVGRDKTRVRYVFFYFETDWGLSDPKHYAINELGIDPEQVQAFLRPSGESREDQAKRFRALMQVLSRVSAARNTSAVVATAAVLDDDELV